MVKNTTTSNQFEKLVSLMQTNPNIALAKNVRKGESIVFWNMVAKELNKLGPPVKDVIIWKKVWVDYKGYIKKRMRRNIESETKGDSKLYHFSDLGEKVVQLLKGKYNSDATENFIEFRNIDSSYISVGSNSTVDNDNDEKSGAAHHKSSIDQKNSRNIDDIKNDDLEMSLDAIDEDDINMCELVKTQTNIQKKFYDDILNFMSDQKKQNKKICEQYEELNTNLINIQATLDRLCDIQEAKTTEAKRHNISIEKMKYRKLELQKQK